MGPAVRAPRFSRHPSSWAQWRATLTLRRAQLRTRVLAGVLAVTVIALVVFDFAAVGALRRYLVGHTDAQLQTVLGLYRPMNIALPSGDWVSGRQVGGAGQAIAQAVPHPPGGPRPGGAVAA